MPRHKNPILAAAAAASLAPSAIHGVKQSASAAAEAYRELASLVRGKAKKKKNNNTKKKAGQAFPAASRQHLISRGVGIPSAGGVVSTNRSTTISPVRLQVSVIGFKMNSVAGMKFNDLAGLYNYNYLQLSPYTNFKPFGKEAYGMAALFTKWRLMSLKLDYLPQVATSTNGSFGVGLCNDPALDVAVATNIADAINWDGFTAGPVWLERELCGVRGIKYGEWLYTFAGALDAANERESSVGILVANTFNGAADALYGLVRVTAVLEFDGLANISAEASRQQPSSSLSPSLSTSSTPARPLDAAEYKSPIDAGPRYVMVEQPPRL